MDDWTLFIGVLGIFFVLMRGASGIISAISIVSTKVEDLTKTVDKLWKSVGTLQTDTNEMLNRIIRLEERLA